MAKSTVYRKYEVRDGFGPIEVGKLVFESEDRGEADHEAEDLWQHGSNVQLFGVPSEEHSAPVLLRALTGLKAA
jgi:hypothetical protein